MQDRFAIISDIHSNLEALTEVLKEIDRRQHETIYCLGDVVGYGPDPEACSDLVRSRCERTIRGNHDEALFSGAERFNPFARSAIRFTRERLKPGILRGRVATERWEWLRGLPMMFRRGQAIFVHGSPRDPVNEYVYQEDVYFNAEPKLQEIFSATEQIVFCGHTHVPVYIRSDLKTIVPTGECFEHQIEPEFKYIINCGSVGQPRDRDPRACWVEVEGDTVRHHRVPYDFSTTAGKIQKIALLDEILGTRLSKGM
ncbi:MAG TPA: metallophosphoesterase family protein [Planctomycetota bacterium]|jgi:predicted phosphodiesterase|nr:metallophosphoesterase family protein [Planctomycetota bacterium]